MLPELALMGHELDRSKGAGETHDKERDPRHYVDLTEDGGPMDIVRIDAFGRLFVMLLYLQGTTPLDWRRFTAQ
jgi:hypothetical protein